MIETEAAINAAIEAVDTWDGGSNKERERYIREALEKLPPAPPYYVTGFWLIRRWGDDAKCSNCGKTFKDVYDMENYDGFCRHCGTKMEGIKVTK